MGYYVDEVKTVSQYAVINFKNADGTIFKAVRCMINENVDLPYFPTDTSYSEDPITGNKYYSFVVGWKDEDGNPVNNIVAPDLNNSNDYFIDIYNLLVDKVVVMETENDGSQGMLSNDALKIISNKKIYLANTSYGYYLIRPSISYSYTDNGDILNEVIFTVDNMVDFPGQTTSLEPEFTVYKDVNNTEKIGTINFEILVVHSSELTGD